MAEKVFINFKKLSENPHCNESMLSLDEINKEYNSLARPLSRIKALNKKKLIKFFWKKKIQLRQQIGYKQKKIKLMHYMRKR